MIWKEMTLLRSQVFQRTIQVALRNITTGRSLNKDHYAVLGVKKDASQADIKNAYFELSKIYHPDRIAATDENLAKFREISAAYEVLGNEASRKLYDRGMIGEKMGIDETEDLSDPIIKFYKSRLDRSKVPTVAKTDESMEAWTQSFYRKTRADQAKKTELFTHKQVVEIPKTVFEKNILLVSVLLVLTFLVGTQIEDHPIREFVLETFKFSKSN